jgi:hypothetical protein
MSRYAKIDRATMTVLAHEKKDSPNLVDHQSKAKWVPAPIDPLPSFDPKTQRVVTTEEVSLVEARTVHAVVDRVEIPVRFEDFQDRFTAPEWSEVTDFVYAHDVSTGKPKHSQIIAIFNRGKLDLLSASTDALMASLVKGNVISAQRKNQILTP